MIPVYSKNFKTDFQARSSSIFAVESSIAIACEEIEILKAMAGKAPTGNARICLHSACQDKFHNMIILETKNGRYYRPHKHLLKAETCHIIEGVLDILLFNDDGTILKYVTLAVNRTLIMRIGAGVWHTVLPSTPFCIYHESKVGPFDPGDDSIFPQWAPDGTDLDKGLHYLKALKAMCV